MSEIAEEHGLELQMETGAAVTGPIGTTSAAAAEEVSELDNELSPTHTLFPF